ncbi:MAG: HAD family phosphatase [Phormidesmis sp. RL_2_1]|nr:HAD family phosphatase [Phormidesmis sp. RL_2_1]
MQPQVLTPEMSQAALSDVRLVATDMDGTLTTGGEFAPGLLQAFARLQAHDIEVMIVTGRSTGWVSGLVNYLPVVGAIAENGGVYISKANLEPLILPDIPRMGSHRDRLSMIFERLKTRYPQLQPSADNPYRITDWTFDIGELSATDIDWIRQTCTDMTMGFTYSTVQCHLKIDRQNKAAGLIKVLQQQFPKLSATEIITVGDSPNDESLFNPDSFPHSVGVANVAHYLPALAYAPTYLTTAAEGEGFIELVNRLVEKAR